MQFEVTSRDGLARCGTLQTDHGAVHTPAFMPVGTLGALKGIGPESLEQAGAEIMLANLYHLSLRPGIAAIQDLGGIHAFNGWPGPILTDSGGYQVFSLAELRKVDEGGVSFKSVVDGSPRRFTPENVIEMQSRLGVDIAMVLDECPPWPVAHEVAKEALERTQRWAERALEHRQKLALPGVASWTGAVFGIVQGSFYEDLRGAAVEHLRELPFDGFAIGGVSVGEDKTLGRPIVEQVAAGLPEVAPRYLMGVGTPGDLAHAVASGVDLFDCVLPARNARHGTLFTSGGLLRIKNSRFGRDSGPVDPACSCPTCRRTSRAFLHHLFRCGEITARVLATVHNVSYYLDFMQQLREAVASGRLRQRARELTSGYQIADSKD